MGQTNAQRVSVVRREAITTPANDDKQPVADTAWFKPGDTVEFYDIDAAGCRAASLGVRTVVSICPDDAIIVDSVIDTTAASGTAMVENQTLHNAQAAFDRICEQNDFKNRPATFVSDITSGTIDGANNDLIMDTLTEEWCFAVGDIVDVVCDSGAPIIGATIVSIDTNTDEIVIDDNTDISSETNCKLVNTSLTTEIFYLRIKSAIVNVSSENDDEEDHGSGDCNTTVYYTTGLYIINTSKLHLDGRRLKRGTCGTRAAQDFGIYPANNDSLRFTGLVMGTDGNSPTVEIVNAAGTTVAVTGNYPNFVIAVNNNSGAATAQAIASAINADASANKLVQAQYGGDGLGTPAASGPTALAGGLDDGTGDYCEMEQVLSNAISATGYKIMALHIKPDEVNRLDEPPRDDEEIFSEFKVP